MVGDEIGEGGDNRIFSRFSIFISNLPNTGTLGKNSSEKVTEEGNGKSKYNLRG